MTANRAASIRARLKQHPKTSKGAWVPISCTRSADSRQITPLGTRAETDRKSTRLNSSHW